MHKITVIENQTLQDLAIQEMGSIEAIHDLALMNGISANEELLPGTELQIPETAIRKDIVGYYASKSIQPATNVSNDVAWDNLFENGLFETKLFE